MAFKSTKYTEADGFKKLLHVEWTKFRRDGTEKRSITFVGGLAACIGTVLLSRQIQISHGNQIIPATLITELRVSAPRRSLLSLLYSPSALLPCSGVVSWQWLPVSQLSFSLTT